MENNATNNNQETNEELEKQTTSDFEMSDEEFERLTAAIEAGNYESLNEIDRENVYFLFMAKCNMVAKGLNVPNMSLICKKH